MLQMLNRYSFSLRQFDVPIQTVGAAVRLWTLYKAILVVHNYYLCDLLIIYLQVYLNAMFTHITRS